ncbi:MAG: ATP-binding protein [Rectinema sp.]|jgi:tRNA 2-thiocytidine biosynthesis protein TtcA|uniref:PP-loop domain protein n=1 Tax=uncultured spirochete TaxID=156406 RepID=A0A3P3XS75_9SPIR|nr:PP-loop domain protein [uncultured spirochete]
MKDARTTLSKLTEIALRHYEMIQPGDNILVAVSGGKDSSCLAWDLALKRQWWDVPFEITACHVATDLADKGYAKPIDEAWLASRMTEWGIPYVRLDVPVAGRLKPGETMNCYWCATQRRTELMKYAQAHGFNKLALGHHMDDILETLFMNMMKKGEFATMPPVMPYKKYPLTVIRPLSLCEERQIIGCADELNLTSFTCSCSFNLEGERKKTRRLIDQITGDSSHIKRNIFASMSRVRPDYLA